tara:strand:+ start:75260 stop:78496 length:3237 start_codon:yes stop_codon:yes gene_type:complete
MKNKLRLSEFTEKIFKKNIKMKLSVLFFAMTCIGLKAHVNTHDEIVEFLNTEILQETITGKVVDENNIPLIGVTIIEKGTTNGTTTDFDGNYSISVNSSSSILVFSSIGYTIYEVSTNGKSVINAVLSEDAAKLDEVIVVGYGTQKKETVTGSVGSIKGSEINKSPSVNLTNSLAGRVSGLFVSQAGSEPGYDDAQITIRGTNTYNNSGALVVIDGIPDRDGGLSRLNSADIENISVLKDASAAIYGARAANGVILVTTKRGKVGKTSITYSFNQGWAQPTKTPDMANAAQYAELVNELRIYELPTAEWEDAAAGFASSGSFTQPGGNVVNAPWSPADIALFGNGQDPWGHPDTDWFGETFKTSAPQQKHTLQMSGGTEDIRYFTSLGYLDQDAIYKNSATGFEQYDIRINLDAKINDYMKLSMGLMGRQEIRKYPTESAGAIFRMLTRGRPTEVAYWPNGLPGPDIENGQQPVVITTSATGYDNEIRDYFQSNATLDIDIPWIKGLAVQGTAAIDKSFRNRKVWTTPWVLYGWDGSTLGSDGLPELVAGQKGPPEPNLFQATQNTLNILLGANISYKRTFGDHGFNFLAGTNKETIEYEQFNAYRRFFISPAIDDLFAGGDAEKDNGGSSDRAARLNYFGRVNYDYKEKYLLEFLWRYDGSYLFPENSRYGFFPGVSGGWVLSKEKFLENSSAINFLKLRGSWGQLGNDKFNSDDFPSNQFLATYGYGSYIINNSEVTTLYETKVPNDQITWEVARNANIGLDAKFLKNKLSLEIDFFSNKRSEILTQPSASLPNFTGITPPRQNIGEVENKGFDFMLGYNDYIGDDFTFGVSLNGGYAKNTILFNDEAEGSPIWQRQTGHSIGSILAYGYEGIFATQADIDAETLDYSSVTNNLRPGDMKFRDYNGDGAITPDDRFRTDKNVDPRFSGGLNLTAGYKNFDMTMFFQGAAGGELFLAFGEAGTIGNYTTSTYNNRWSVTNPSSVHPRITNRADQYFSRNNTYWLESTDYVRLKNFEIGYTMPDEVIEKLGFSSMRFYVSGSNLFTIADTTFDPEGESVDGRDYPNSRIINSGFSISF